MKRPSQRASSQGSVFIIVLVVCLGLVSLTLVFGHSMVMTYRGEETELAGRQAEQAIQGAARYAEELIASGTSPQLPDLSTYQSEAVPVGDATFWFIGEPPSSPTTQVTDEPSFGLVDEASKLNLNTASLTMLENLPDMTPDLAQAIVQWRTASTSTSAGTSAATTEADSTSKGGPFESLAELAQVNDQNGGDPTILYGDDLNLNHVLDTNENHGGGQFNPGIFEYTTVFSREPNTQASGAARVNVTQTNAAMTSLLTTTFGQSRGTQIVRRLASGGPVRSVLEFYIRSGISATELDTLTPKLTMKGGAFSTGLINVNTASTTVLQCIPGITQSIAAQIVSARANQTTASTNLAWLVAIMGNAVAVQAGPYLTTYCYQVTADVAAVGRLGRGYRRTLFVIDSSTGTPEIVYRRNMASLGWALGPTALQTLASNKVVQ
jgi:DNA uptake protein ComE-like DNA-binding protein